MTIWQTNLHEKAWALASQLIRLWRSRTSLDGAPFSQWLTASYVYGLKQSIKVKRRSWVLLNWGWQTHSLWTAEGSYLQQFAELSELVISEQPHLVLIPLITKHATKSVMGESECVASQKVIIQQRLPYRIEMTDAVWTATLADPSEQQKKFDSHGHTDKCKRNSLMNNDQ